MARHWTYQKGLHDLGAGSFAWLQPDGSWGWSNAGLVTDGVVRDGAGVLASGLPVWCQGVAAPPSVAGLTFVGWQEPIGCGGVAVFPNDVVVVDADGAVLIPADLLEAVVDAAVEQERQEAWIMQEVQAGAALPGLYPPNEANQARYEAWKRGTS